MAEPLKRRLVGVRLLPAELKRLQDEAARMGVPYSVAARMFVLRALRKEAA